MSGILAEKNIHPLHSKLKVNRMGNRKDNQSQLNDCFDILNDLGEGGNGKVSFARDKTSGEVVAVKILIKGGKEKRQRFLDEIQIVEKYSASIAGMIPILQSCPEEFWYSMPVAEAIMKHIKKTESSAVEIVQGGIQLAETLNQLHSNNVSHRDIKPDNILFYDGRYCLSDFGLASFPENPDEFTRSDKGLGAIFTIAPEMKRDPKHADGKKADVFSLAKTMWMLLMGDNRGFDGVYNPFDPSHSLRYADHLSDVHLVELERLLTVSTNNDPELRPDMESFRNGMVEWLEILRDNDRTQASEWNFINQYLFGENTPELAVWRDRETIVHVLNAVGTLRAFNHMLFSDHGGLDFKSAEEATEEGCICIADTLGFLYIAKPEFLCLETFGDDYVWSYFLLQFSPLKPILEDGGYGHAEYLVEDKPGHYVSDRDSVYGVYDYDTGEKLPEGYRNVIRYLTGTFLIVLKGSPYNGIPATYDGRHGLCDRATFRKYMEYLREIYRRLKAPEIPEETILNLEVFRKNPFEDERENIPKVASKRNWPDEYIESNFLNWSFQDIISLSGVGAIAFSFSFHLKRGGSVSDIMRNQDQRYFLCSDGKIHRNPLEGDIYYIHDRNSANQIKSFCEKRIFDFCRDAGFDDPDLVGAHFEVHLKRCGKPSHLFTKEEIGTLMRSADDRKRNILVIDEDGTAKIIQDTTMRFLYPVRHEAWEPRNNYVGKYSTLSTLDTTYLQSLQGWLGYLESGQRQYMDYTHSEQNIDHLIEKIRQYY